MGDDGEAPAPGYYAYGTTEGEGDRNDQKERHGKGTAYFANGDKHGKGCYFFTATKCQFLGYWEAAKFTAGTVGPTEPTQPG